MTAPPRPEATRAVLRGALRLLLELDRPPVVEMPLPDGRRADLAALGGDGAVWIVEVKSGWADFQADQKWRDYAAWCDRFWFAVDEAFPLDAMPEDVGVIVADGYGAAVVREAPEHKLAPARRSAVVRRLARTAAARAAAGLLDGAL